MVTGSVHTALGLSDHQFDLTICLCVFGFPASTPILHRWSEGAVGLNGGCILKAITLVEMKI